MLVKCICRFGVHVPVHIPSRVLSTSSGITLLPQEVLARTIEGGALGVFHQIDGLLRPPPQASCSSSDGRAPFHGHSPWWAATSATSLHYPSLLCRVIAEEFGLALPLTSELVKDQRACLERLYAAAMCQRGITMDDNLAKDLIQVGYKPDFILITDIPLKFSNLSSLRPC